MFKKLLETTKKRKKQILDDRSKEEREVDTECAIKAISEFDWGKAIRDFMRA